MKRFLKSFLAKLVGVLALLLVGVMIYAATTGGLATLPATIAGAVITPLQTVVSRVSDAVGGFFHDLGGTGRLQERIAKLEKQNAELIGQQVDYDKLKQQNEWYNEILGLHEQHPDYAFASARVIARDPADAYGNFTVGSGSNAGIAAGAPVVTTGGYLVGVVEEVGLTFAKVRTITDPGSRVAVQISRTGDTAYTNGSTVEQAGEGILRLATLERTSGASVGDIVITSGIGGVYPAELPMGRIRSITAASDGMTLDAEIELFADIGELRQVMIITSFERQGE